MDFDYPDVPVEAGRQPVLPAEEFFARTARGLVESQAALDEVARLSMIDWQENGIPPSAYCWSSFRITFPAALGCRPKGDATEQSLMRIAPRFSARGALSFGFRFLATPPEEE